MFWNSNSAMLALLILLQPVAVWNVFDARLFPILKVLSKDLFYKKVNDFEGAKIQGHFRKASHTSHCFGTFKIVYLFIK